MPHTVSRRTLGTDVGSDSPTTSELACCTAEPTDSPGTGTEFFKKQDCKWFNQSYSGALFVNFVLFNFYLFNFFF